MRREQSSLICILMAMVGVVSGVSAESMLTARRVATGLSRPTFATMPPGESDRLFITEQFTGRIEILDLSTGQIDPTPFLDLNDLSRGNEQGLLGLAFDPNFQENGFFYVNYTERSGATNIDRYTVSENVLVANPDSRQRVMRFGQPQGNHNGGWIGFGPNDNYLYISSGDGGGGNDSGTGHTSGIGNSQDITNNLLGKMLRIDVSEDDFPNDANRNYAIPPNNPFVNQTGDDEIWSYGLRNAWRASFDRTNGDLYIADVGQGAREEVDFQPANSIGGENYGWRLREGTIRTPGSVGGNAPLGAIEPIHEYRHSGPPDGGFSITGGYVYRGPIGELAGSYFFADFVTEQIWSLKHDGTQTTEVINWTESIRTDAGSITGISSFAEDNAGNLYVISLDGDVFQLHSLTQVDTIVEPGELWRYLDDGSNQMNAWMDVDFEDADWKQGRAELGYGDNDEVTEIEFGPDLNNRFVTSYFRHAFHVDSVEAIDSLELGLLYDDGAAVYLNGVEVVRTDNLAPDAGYLDFADFNGASARSGRNEDIFERFSIDPSLLVAGRNVLAAEVHQFNRNSSDLSFNLKLDSILRDLLGDFDRNGIRDTSDVDALTLAMRMGNREPQFDVDASGELNQSDLVFWVTELKQTWIGDSDLNGEFTTADLIMVFQAGQYEDDLPLNSTWGTGDWNGDGDFTTQDLIFAFQDGGFEQGPRNGVNAVPEPNVWIMILVGIISTLRWRSR